jgi:hypothetical protein
MTVEWIDGNLFDVTRLTAKTSPAERIKAQKILNPSFLGKLWRPDLVMGTCPTLVDSY